VERNRKLALYPSAELREFDQLLLINVCVRTRISEYLVIMCAHLCVTVSDIIWSAEW
jgi:hypothetical protein